MEGLGTLKAPSFRYGDEEGVPMGLLSLGVCSCRIGQPIYPILNQLSHGLFPLIRYGVQLFQPAHFYSDIQYFLHGCLHNVYTTMLS